MAVGDTATVGQVVLVGASNHVDRALVNKLARFLSHSNFKVKPEVWRFRKSRPSSARATAEILSVS